jgi:hypothetical protein
MFDFNSFCSSLSSSFCPVACRCIYLVSFLVTLLCCGWEASGRIHDDDDDDSVGGRVCCCSAAAAAALTRTWRAIEGRQTFGCFILFCFVSIRIIIGQDYVQILSFCLRREKIDETTSDDICTRSLILGQRQATITFQRPGLSYSFSWRSLYRWKQHTRRPLRGGG